MAMLVIHSHQTPRSLIPISQETLLSFIPATRNGFKQLKTEETVEQGVFGDRQAIEPGVVSL